MNITSNAESRDDKALVARHEALHPEATHDLKFLTRHVVVFDAAAGAETRYTRKQYQEYLDALEAPQEPSGDTPEALPPQTGEPRSGFSQAPAAKHIDERLIQDISDAAFAVGVAEREDEDGKNSARFERGELMIRLASVSQTERTPFKEMLARVNERMAARAAENNLADFQLITKEEATTTRRVVEAFGSSAEFRLVNAVNPNTGEPLVGDDGKAPVTSIRKVPMNKLYAVVDYAGEKDLDTLLSFAYRYSERVVKKVKSIAKNQNIPVTKLIKKLDKVKREAEHMVTGAVIKVQADEKLAMENLRKLAGEAPPPDVVSLKTDRAWVEGFWEPLKALFTAAVREFNPELLPEGTQVTNVFVFERTIGQFFNVNADSGIRGAIGALIEAEDLTAEQASEFLERFAYNPGSGEWEASGPAELPPAGDGDGEDWEPDGQGDEDGDDFDDDFEADQAADTGEADDDEGFEDVSVA